MELEFYVLGTGYLQDVKFEIEPGTTKGTMNWTIILINTGVLGFYGVRV